MEHLDKREICIRTEFETCQFMVLCNFIAPRGHKIFVALLVNPFFVNCIIFHQYPSINYTSKFHNIQASRDAFGSFTFVSFSAKNILVVVAVMIVPSMIECSMFFFQSKLLVLLYIFLKYMTSLGWLILFFIGKFCIFRLKRTASIPRPYT